MLKFEHLVQVNDPVNPEISLLTRDQLWQGLELRARIPERFVDGLQSRIEPVSDSEFLRYVVAGDSEFCEQVLLYPKQSICSSTVPNRSAFSAKSTVTIEEPEEKFLFVRFSYQRELEDDAQLDIGEHLKSAYVQVDTHAVAMIRMMVEKQILV